MTTRQNTGGQDVKIQIRNECQIPKKDKEIITKTPAVACPPAVGRLWCGMRKIENTNDNEEKTGVRSQNKSD